MHNDHVRKLWRWRAWVARQQGNQMAHSLYIAWAEDEREAQK